MSILQRQLAAIASNSSRQLDLKAQRAAHGKSLLFDAKIAVSQDFNTLYQICFEGFEELCILDARFVVYSTNVFSEQSKSEERGQMTADQNKELDVVLQSFLGLVGSRLLLKPAQKAVEWLIRRFRVHEFNTEDLLLTFLPFHSTPLFLALLAILPPKIPPTFRFLQPYISSLSNPPAHSIVYTAINTPVFFSAFCQHVLRTARNQNHSSALLSFWSSIATQSVEGILNNAQSGIETVRKQRQESVLLQILPVINDALAIDHAHELIIGTCMIITVLAARGNLEDNVLDSLMEAVAIKWNPQTADARLISLAVLAQERHSNKISKTLAKRLLALNDLVDRLILISGQYRIDKLALGLLLRCIGRLHKTVSDKEMAFVKKILDSNILSRSQLSQAIKALLSVVASWGQEGNYLTDSANVEVRTALGEIISSLAESPPSRPIFDRVVEKNHFDLNTLELSLQTIIRRDDDDANPPDADLRIADVAVDSSDFDVIISTLPSSRSQAVSFLGIAAVEEFEHLAGVYMLALRKEVSFEKFLQLPCLRKDDVFDGDPTFVSFFVHMFSGNYPLIARVRAIRTLAALISEPDALQKDFQVLIPYLISALMDPSSQVRRAAAECLIAVERKHKSKDSPKKASDPKVWAKDSLYPENPGWPTTLPYKDVAEFLQKAILPDLEECIMDETVISRMIKIVLGGSSSKEKRLKVASVDFKSNRRSAIFAFLASHATLTAVMTVTMRLLSILNQLGKAGSQSRVKILIPALRDSASIPVENVEAQCTRLRVSLLEYNSQLMRCITPREPEGLDLLEELINGGLGATRVDLIKPTFQRLTDIWTSLQDETRQRMFTALLDLAMMSPEDSDADLRRSMALETLQSLSYASQDLVYLLETLPNALNMPDKPPAAKRRRTSRSEMTKAELKPKELAATLQRYTLVLEVIGSSDPSNHPKLLKGLFHVLAELQHFGAQTDSGMVYIRGLTINSLLAIVDKMKDTPEIPEDRSIIRTDLVVDSIRTTSNPQLQNAALLLISCLASWLPDLVLHSVMPIFTFMGNTILRQGDDYSAHVIDQTVSRVVPPLVASLKKKSGPVVSGVSDILLSFTAAFEHIPSHRRLGLFEHVVDMLGPRDCLFAVLVMIVDRYPTDWKAQRFISDLINRFDPTVELRALIQYVDLVTEIFKPRRALADTVLNLKEKPEDQIQAIADNLLNALSGLLDDDGLRVRLVESFHDEDELAVSQRAAFSELMQATIRLSQQLKSSPCSAASNQALSNVFKLLPMVDLIGCAEILLSHTTDDIRDVVIQSIGSRVEIVKQNDTESTSALLGFVSRATDVVIHSTKPLHKYSAITCVDRISERFGKRDVSKVLPAAKTIASEDGLGHSDGRLQIVSLLCLASMVEVLGDEIIPLIPPILSRTFSLLEQSMGAERSNSSLHNACFALINSIVEHLPFIVSGEPLDKALRLTNISARNGNDDTEESREQFYELISRKTGVAETFAALDRSYEFVQAQRDAQALFEYFELVKMSIDNHTKSQILKCSSVLFSILFKGFDLRRIRRLESSTFESQSAVDVVELEGKIIEVALTLVLKLNDATFRPFFIRLVEWVSSAPKEDLNGLTSRSITLFSFLTKLFERLKSLMTSYMSYVLELTANLFENNSKTGDTDQQLITAMLGALEQSFEHDQDEFWQSPSHFEAISSPLLQLLGTMTGRLVSTQVISAVVALAGAVSSVDHYKVMNSELLKLMRSENAAARLVAVKCELALTDRLGEEWLALLPEMLPFITELLEDDEESVEKETRAWIAMVEDILGESLEGMLQ